MFPRPVSMKNAQKTARLIARLEQHKLVNVVDNADGTQTIKSNTPNLDREFLIGTDNQIYLLADIKRYLSTASDADIQAARVAFRSNESKITLTELKACPENISRIDYIKNFSTLLLTLNPRNYSADLAPLNSIADLNKAIAIHGSTSFDNSISQASKQIRALKANMHVLLGGAPDTIILDEANLKNLDDEILSALYIAAPNLRHLSPIPHTIVTDAWICLIDLKLKLYSQLTQTLLQTNDEAFKKSLRQEIDKTYCSIEDIKFLLSHIIKTHQYLYNAKTLMEDRYQAHILKYPQFAMGKPNPPVKSRLEKALPALAFLAKGLAATLIVASMLTLLFFGIYLLASAFITTSIALTFVFGITSVVSLVSGFSMMFSINNILKNVFDRIVNFGEYLKIKFSSSKSDAAAFANPYINAYAETRADNIAGLEADKQALNRLKSLMVDVAALKARSHAEIIKSQKQTIKGEVLPTVKMAGTLFSVAKAKPSDGDMPEVENGHSLRRQSLG